MLLTKSRFFRMKILIKPRKNTRKRDGNSHRPVTAWTESSKKEYFIQFIAVALSLGEKRKAKQRDQTLLLDIKTVHKTKSMLCLLHWDTAHVSDIFVLPQCASS